MKKLLAGTLILFSLISSAFTYNWFDERYFELSVGAKFGLSNNSLKINDVFQKDLVIDLKKFAADMPKNGLDINSYILPEFALKLNLRKVEIGLTTGTEVWAEGNLSKDLFNYIGNGNSINQSVNISQKVNMDAFAYQEVSVGFKIKDFKIVARPCLFLPLVHIGSSKGHLKLENLSDGSLIVDYSSDLDIYSVFSFSDFKKINPGFGFDLAASVSYPLFDFLTLTGNARIPIVPGSLRYKTVQTTSLSFNATMDKIMNGGMGDKNFSSKREDSQSTTYYINRPMKFSAFADFTPFGKWIVFTGGLGLGFRHPFTDDIDSFDCFGEYYLAGTIKLLNILKATFSSEYYEKLFIHQFTFSANARILEIMLGINTQASDFKKSCSGTGIGGLFAVKIGY